MRRKSFIFILLTGSIFILSSLVISSGNSKSDPLIFSHEIHAIDAELDCDYCHEGIAAQPAGGKSIAGHDVCGDCHEVEDIDNCGTCHSNPDDPAGYIGGGYFYLGFAHNDHLGDVPDCEDCHVMTEEMGYEPGLPDMKDCQSCHRHGEGELDCAGCHLGVKPEPADHGLITWMEDHGIDASSGASDCAMCHEQDACDDCHQGVNLTSGDPHPPTWKFNHFSETMFGGECMVCHETRESCIMCHRAMTPMPHALGPAYANAMEGGEHAAEAEMFYETCLSCHDTIDEDPTCAKCHE